MRSFLILPVVLFACSSNSPESSDVDTNDKSEESVEPCAASVKSELRYCVNDDLETAFGDAFHTCITDEDALARMQGAVCDGTAEYCDLTSTEFRDGPLQACAEELGPRYTCVFGPNFGSFFSHEHLRILNDDRKGIQDVASMSDVEKEQILAAAQIGAVSELDTLEKAFEYFDRNQMRMVQFWDGSNGGLYTVYEYGAGDNSFGAFFDSQNQLVARIVDADIYDGSDGERLGCSIPVGDGWRDCATTSECADGLMCEGVISHPKLGEVGRCIDPQAGRGSSTFGEDCMSDADCSLEDGLRCAGASPDFPGTCAPLWKFGTFVDAPNSYKRIPDQQTLARDLYVYGLATVAVDASIRVRLKHEDPKQLIVRLVPPLRDEGTTMVLFSGESDAVPGQEVVDIDMKLPFPSDESVNGQWTLQIEDTARGWDGRLEEWSLDFASEFD